jgi:hypothetical protein
VFNATFNDSSAISWGSVLLEGETGFLFCTLTTPNREGILYLRPWSVLIRCVGWGLGNVTNTQRVEINVTMFKDDKHVIWMWLWLILKNISLLDRIWSLWLVRFAHSPPIFFCGYLKLHKRNKRSKGVAHCIAHQNSTFDPLISLKGNREDNFIKGLGCSYTVNNLNDGFYVN